MLAVLRNAKSLTAPPSTSNLQLVEGEIIIDVDGTVPTQPIFQHTGISAWPGRLTLSNRAIYFEPLGVGSYDKAVVYDLSMDLKQVIKPELTGPLGARLFDTAVMYKATSISEPVYLEFAEFKGHSRRDYWLSIILEIFHVHSFIRKFSLKENQQAEALAKATLGIFRYRAVKEAFHFMPSHFKTLLPFSLVDNLPKGDKILDALAHHLELLDRTVQTNNDPDISSYLQLQAGSLQVFLVTLIRFGFLLPNEVDGASQTGYRVGDVYVGEKSPLELVVKWSISASGRAEAAQATVDQVKVEGIDTNIAVMKEAISEFEALVREGNIILLKLRALLFAAFPQATDTVILSLIATAAVCAFVPLKHVMILVLLEAYTRQMPLRRHSSEKLIRRLKEWWMEERMTMCMSMKLFWQALQLVPSKHLDIEDGGPVPPLMVSLAAGFSGSVAAAASHCFDTAKSRHDCSVLPKLRKKNTSICTERQHQLGRRAAASFRINAFFNPLDERILNQAIKEPVAFMGGMFAGLLRLDLNEEPLKEWLTRTVETSGITEEEIGDEASTQEDDEAPLEIEIE
ncbi:UPF0426 protein [Acorus calamus]|uniref:UPF0426 protein n=1 Tax=Acorus calamus TaxID=4465 RepID=A0AAV9DVV2_ACOCL|nr:UPF0426 protein [Acorus calamus]